ncbi:MAG: hypothetical protein WED12_08980 [Chloroflexota bacterium]
MIGSPYVLYGALGQLRDLLERRRGRTEISYYAIRQGSMETMAPLVEALAANDGLLAYGCQVRRRRAEIDAPALIAIRTSSVTAIDQSTAVKPRVPVSGKPRELGAGVGAEVGLGVGVGVGVDAATVRPNAVLLSAIDGSAWYARTLAATDAVPTLAGVSTKSTVAVALGARLPRTQLIV